MKIGILTLPLHENYGGLLQAYALKEILESLQHEVVIINRQNPKRSKLLILCSKIKSLILKGFISPTLTLSKEEEKIIFNQILSFKEKYIPNFTQLITSDKGMLNLNKMDFDAYVVGSDQCWRPIHSPKISNYFFDFAESQKNIKRLAYAASFGVSEWEFSENDTKRCSELAKMFNGISVREDSGVTLVKNHLGVNSVHLIDPTMLLKKEHYIQMSKDEVQFASEDKLKVYILDKTLEKQKIINSIEKELGLKQFEVLPKKNLILDKFEDYNDFVYPSPTKWIRGYQDAKFVVTDSFHGSVFSILFNIPFIAIGNKKRGMARFESLLKKFGLENRLITNIETFDIKRLTQSDINWNSVNMILEKEREKAMSFLKTSLSN